MNDDSPISPKLGFSVAVGTAEVSNCQSRATFLRCQDCGNGSKTAGANGCTVRGLV